MTLRGFKDLHLKNIIMDIHSIENNETGRLEGVNFAFKPVHEDKIYNKTNGKPVGFFPPNLNINLDMKSVIQLNALFLETLSSYLYNLRQKIFEKDMIEIIKPRTDDNYYIKVRVSRYFFREEEKGRYKISIAIIKKGEDGLDDTEIVNINYTKRDIIVLSSVLKRIASSYMRDNATTIFGEYVDTESKEVVQEKNCMIAKIDNSIVIDNIWLHGQELMNVMFVVQELTYNLHIEERLDSLVSFYRQVRFIREGDILYLELSKMNRDHEYVYSEYEDKQVYLKVPFSNFLLSTLYLYLDINILRHADFEEEFAGDIEIMGSSKTNLGKGVKYHVSMKESLIGIAINERRKNPEQSKISLVGKVKEGHFSEINEMGIPVENYIKIYDEDNNEKLIPILMEFDIDMRDQWLKLIKGLSVALTGEYKEKREFNNLKFFVINQTPMGRYKYQFKIISDPGNKAPAVLIIDKYKLKNKEEILESRYRQPLFKKYVYQLISIILSSAQDIENIDFIMDISTKELLHYQYKSFKKVSEVKKGKEIKFGIKKHEDETLFGNFTNPNSYVKLRFQDKELINISSYFRLINGYWVPFVGDKIAIGQDGYLTDIFGEINLEEDENGVVWAAKLYFGTSE